MVLYYEYNREGKRPLRVQITEEEYIAARAQPDRWFINFGNCVLEVSREEYVKYSKDFWHSRYNTRYAYRNGIKVQSLDAMEENVADTYPLLADQTVEETVIEKLSMEELTRQLAAALRELDADELHLIIEFHFHKKPQKQLSEEFGISQQAVSKRLQKVLRKLREKMEGEQR